MFLLQDRILAYLSNDENVVGAVIANYNRHIEKHIKCSTYLTIGNIATDFVWRQIQKNLIVQRSWINFTTAICMTDNQHASARPMKQQYTAALQGHRNKKSPYVATSSSHLNFLLLSAPRIYVAGNYT